MFRIKKIDHVAVCVAAISPQLKAFQKAFGLKAGEVESSSELQTKAVLMPVGESHIELIEPMAGNTGLEKFLNKRGPGLHHIALEVEGLDAALQFLKSIGVPLIDEQAKVGARGHRVAFLHPKAFGGVLVELVESNEG